MTYERTYEFLTEVARRETKYNQLKVESIPYIQKIQNKKDSGELGIITSLRGLKM